MAHQSQQDFCERVKARFPAYFTGTTVLDCGSLDINGSNRPLFAGGRYTGVDIAPGRNVDLVSAIHDLKLADGAFDVIVSTECFEHDRHYADSLRNIVRMLRARGGSCSSRARRRGGPNTARGARTRAAPR